MGFLPDNYNKLKPNNDNYMKFKDGANTFRILSEAVAGYEGWKREGDNSTPMRFTEQSDAYKTPGLENIKFFIAFAVWNYDAQKIQILKIHQTGIRDSIEEYVLSPKWGDPSNYDFTVKRSGEGLETKYIVTANPPEPITEEIAEAYAKSDIDWDAYMKCEDPFGGVSANQSVVDNSELVDEIF